MRESGRSRRRTPRSEKSIRRPVGALGTLGVRLEIAAVPANEHGPAVERARERAFGYRWNNRWERGDRSSTMLVKLALA